MRKMRLIGGISLFLSMFTLASCLVTNKTSDTVTQIPTSRVTSNDNATSNVPSTNNGGNNTTTSTSGNATPSTSNQGQTPSSSTSDQGGQVVPSSSSNQGQVVPSSSSNQGQVVPSSSSNQGEVVPSSSSSVNPGTSTSSTAAEPTGSTQNTEKVTIAFFDGTTELLSMEVDKGVTMPSFPKENYVNLKVETGYKLIGWMLDDKFYDFDDSIVISDNFNFYAVIVPNNQTYDLTLTFIDRGKEVAETPWDKGQILYFPTANDLSISNPGYKLIGWKHNTTVYSFSDKYIVSADTTFYAEWVLENDENVSTVRFYDGDDLIVEYQYYIGSSCRLPYAEMFNLNKSGYTFGGWELNEKTYKEDELFNLEDDYYEFQAKWNENQTPVSKDGLDIYINYSGDGISLKEDSFENAVENITYTKGDLLPVWKTFSEKLKMEIRDASAYTTSKEDDTYISAEARGFISETDESQYIDLMYNSTKNITDAAKSGLAVDLLPYLGNGSMPNFKEFLNNNPSIYKQLIVNGGIYYTPYFDEYNTIERSFMMDTAIVKLILDEDTDDNNKDATIKQGGEGNRTGNGITTPKNGSFMKPFVGSWYYNYANDTTVNVSVNAKLQPLTIKKTTNIVAEQNKLLADGTSGKILRKQLRDYLNTAYEGNVGPGKVYEHLSDIFISEAASYNTDDLIALMRVVKASSELITGSESNEVEVLLPRGTANNRNKNILQFIKIFGIQGMVPEKDFLYFDSNGKLNDAAVTKQTYEALEYLSMLYAEGLIVDGFWDISKSENRSDATYYLNGYFKHTSINVGYGFMMFDYSATTSIANDIDEHGIGTKPESRQYPFNGVAHTGFMPVLSPLTYWLTEEYGNDYNALTSSITDRTYKTLIRYEEDNRSLKSTGWFIPASSDNIEDAVRMMDYLYSNEGRMINNFGPSQYWKDGLIDNYQFFDEKTPALTDEFWNMFKNNTCDYLTFMRRYIGAGHGIGYIRSSVTNFNSTNQYAQPGVINLMKSIASGATILSLNDSGPTFARAVPVIFDVQISQENSMEYSLIDEFFKDNKASVNADGWVKYITELNVNGLADDAVVGSDSRSDKDYTMNDVKNSFSKRIEIYLYAMASYLGDTYIPDYAKQ